MTINLYLVLNCFVQNAWEKEKKRKSYFLYIFLYSLKIRRISPTLDIFYINK